MDDLTFSEVDFMYHLRERLSLIRSPVVRSRLLLQFSQLLDMAYLGDASEKDHKKIVQLIDEVEDLTDRLSKYEDVD